MIITEENKLADRLPPWKQKARKCQKGDVAIQMRADLQKSQLTGAAALQIMILYNSKKKLQLKNPLNWEMTLHPAGKESNSRRNALCAGDISGARGRGKVGLGAFDWSMSGVVWMSRAGRCPDLWVEKQGVQLGVLRQNMSFLYLCTWIT
jgi:hypothetical protein